MLKSHAGFRTAEQEAEDMDEDEGEDQGGWRVKPPGFGRGLDLKEKEKEEAADDWVIEAFLGRGRGEGVRKAMGGKDEGGNKVSCYFGIGFFCLYRTNIGCIDQDQDSGRVTTRSEARYA